MATLHEHYNDSDCTFDAVVEPYGVYWVAQTIQAASSYEMTRVKLKMSRRTGTSPGTVTVRLHGIYLSKPASWETPLASGTINGNTLPEGSANAEWTTVEFTVPYTVTSGTDYSIVVYQALGTPALSIAADSSGPTYGSGAYCVSSNSGASYVGWTIVNTTDVGFECYTGGENPNPPSNPVYTKRLVALGNDQVWFESTVGTMAEMTTARSTISTALPLSAWEGLEKGFIANGSNLKVLDFGNTKLTTATMSTNLPNKANTLTGGTSSAAIVLDYIDSITTAMNLYGKSINTNAFVSAETVTGTNDAGDAVSFTLTAAEVTAPHWYNWTPYGNDTTTYGSMPDQATIGCLYRGRCILAGDPNRPHMWFMSKVINPWDWKYNSLDPLSAIRGGNSDAGEIGDIITSFIPVSDDYLVIGCQDSIWLMRGDPANGGSLDLLSGATGILSQSSWCIDENNSIYFYGVNGLYKLSLDGGQGSPVNISNTKIPNLATDWAINKASHRVVLFYDIRRKGVVLSKAALSSGVNEEYYYDLNVEGIFKEVYPDNLATFAPFFYKATNDAYTDLLLGGYDGYIRKFSDTSKSDADTANAIISSFIALPIVQVVPNEDQEGIINEIVVETAGGSSGGTFSDTDALDISFYTGTDAETMLEDMKDGSTAFLTVALVSTGRQSKIREHIRTKYIGIKLSNSAISSGWAVNRIFGSASPGGKV